MRARIGERFEKIVAAMMGLSCMSVVVTMAVGA
jgi:hypothetical protein